MANIEIILRDDTTTLTLMLPEPPISEATINNDVEVVTLDNNLSVYIHPDTDKRVWSHSWKFMSQVEFNALKGFRDRQRTTFRFPLLSITNVDPAVVDVPVYMTLDPRNIIDNCANVRDVSVVWRESDNIPTWSAP